MPKTDKYLKVAVSAAKQAGKIFTRYFGKPKLVKKKNRDPRNLVTEIDFKIERLIKHHLHRAFPKHWIMGEELGWRDKLAHGDFRWYIDPIDGTSNYIQGLPLCCISIALWDKKGPLVGVIYNPILEELYTAVRGQGAFLNGKKLKVSGTAKMAEAFGCIGWVERENGVKLFAKIIRVCRKVRGLATSALQTCLVGSGVLDFYVTRDLHIWDFAAAVLVVKEAGGKVTDFSGQPVSSQSKGILVSNGKLHRQLRIIVK
jgi:myo-inositol-1(or 4)-monophosphatase